ncbi:MAG: SAM-dependent methyltransferase [Trebonia sp.]
MDVGDRAAPHPEGKTDYFQADVRDPEVILSGAQRTLDFSEPVAVILVFVMHFIPDAEGPYDIVRRLMEPLPSGSYLVMAHAASDIAADFMAAGAWCRWPNGSAPPATAGCKPTAASAGNRRRPPVPLRTGAVRFLFSVFWIPEKFLLSRTPIQRGAAPGPR